MTFLDLDDICSFPGDLIGLTGLRIKIEKWKVCPHAVRNVTAMLKGQLPTGYKTQIVTM